MLTRDVASSNVIGAPVEDDGRWRRLSEFRRVVAAVKGVSPVRPGGERAIEEQQARDAAAAAAGERVSSEFTLLGNMRWRQADSDTPCHLVQESIGARADHGGRMSISRIAKATEAWTTPASARIALAYGGSRSAGGQDVHCSSVTAGVGLITFEDPDNEVDAPVIAIGGGWSGSPSHVVNGQTFTSITHGFVIFQNASDLSSGTRSPDSFMRVLAHEIGHGIGLGHTHGVAGELDVPLVLPVGSAAAAGDRRGRSRGHRNSSIPCPAGPPPTTDLDDDGLLNDWDIRFGLDPRERQHGPTTARRAIPTGTA